MSTKPSLPPDSPKNLRNVGLRIATIVGGFVLLIILIGWAYVALHR